MPLRHMVGDAFSYMKEYDEIAAVNKKRRPSERQTGRQTRRKTGGASGRSMGRYP